MVDRADARALETFFVGDRGGRRCSVAFDGECSLDACLDMLNAAGPHPTRQVEVVAIDDSDARSVPAILVSELGQPLGPIGVGIPLEIEPSFRGLVTARGYIPHLVCGTEIRAHRFDVRLRPAACVHGRVPSDVLTEFTQIQLGDIGARSAPPDRHIDVAQIDRTGNFRSGPIVAGKRLVALEGASALLLRTAREVDLHPGVNDLGELAIERLHDLTLRVASGPSPMPGHLRVRIWFEGATPPRDLPGAEYAVDRDGFVVVAKVRGVPLSIELWTDDGWSGHLSDVRAELTAHDSPVQVVLLPPARLDVTSSIHALSDADECVVVACPIDAITIGNRLLRHGRAPESRIRQGHFTRAGIAVIEGVQPGLNRIEIISSHGTVLAREQIDIKSGQSTSIAVDPVAGVGWLDLSRSAGAGPRRFAIVSPENGIVARSTVAPGATDRCLLPVGPYRVIELSDGAVAQPAESAAIDVAILKGDIVRLSL